VRIRLLDGNQAPAIHDDEQSLLDLIEGGAA